MGGKEDMDSLAATEIHAAHRNRKELLSEAKEENRKVRIKLTGLSTPVCALLETNKMTLGTLPAGN